MHTAGWVSPEAGPAMEVSTQEVNLGRALGTAPVKREDKQDGAEGEGSCQADSKERYSGFCRIPQASVTPGCGAPQEGAWPGAR